ncbi:MAG: dihydropteroate synthase [Dehalococcoidales bacterium]|nr:dihydropteroate synthase [Dehalococcoidales bacterium]
MPLNKKHLSLATTRCGNTEFRWGERTYIMAIINVSPDSFSGDGLGSDIKAAREQAKRFIAEGADIIDVGGESTRPESQPITADEELQRVILAIEMLAAEVTVPISIDTGKSAVASRALVAGAVMINDVYGLKNDPEIARVAAKTGVPIIITSNQRNEPCKGGIIAEVISDLERGITLAEEYGVVEDNIIIDPGIGFGKSLEQNLELIRRLAELKSLGKPILLGTSRKSVIGMVLDLPPDQRLEGTATTVAIGIANGADIIRVHDVKQMARVCRMSDAIIRRSMDER